MMAPWNKIGYAQGQIKEAWSMRAPGRMTTEQIAALAGVDDLKVCVAALEQLEREGSVRSASIETRRGLSRAWTRTLL